MSVVRFFEKRDFDVFKIAYNKVDGVFLDFFPHINIIGSVENVEIKLDNPPSEPFPATGTKNYRRLNFNSVIPNFLEPPSITLHGADYYVDKVTYNIDLGGEQHIYLNKRTERRDTHEDFKRVLNDYTEIMRQFMKQMCDTDYTYKQYVKTNHTNKRSLSLDEIFSIFVNIIGFEITDDDIDKASEMDYPISDYDEINAVYMKLAKAEIDNELKIVTDEE